MRAVAFLAFVALALCLWAGAGAAQSAAPATPGLLLELNAAQDQDGACRLTFVAENRLGVALEAVVFEAVFFTTAGTVDRLTLLDFQDLPEGRKRVRQFDLPGTGCAALGQVLFNAASECRGPGVAPGLCMTALDLRSRTGMEISG
ncbi:MAG TPA: hypothetical protein VGA75_04145 [Paracoccaceae bacterium]